MISKLTYSALLYSTVEGFSIVNYPFDKDLPCNQCIMGGYNYCINKASGWFYFVNSGSSIPTSICCEQRNADGTGGCPNNEDDDKANFLCTSYPENGYFSLRDADNNLVLNDDGSKIVLPTERNKMITFKDKEMAIAACPTYASKCGARKIFEFKSTSFTENSVSSITI